MEGLTFEAKVKLVTNSLTGTSPFDGDSNALVNFIKKIELLIPTFETFDVAIKMICMGLIKDKIVGNARKTLRLNGDPNTWIEIKNALIKNHGERESVEVLIDKIRGCRCDSTIEQFYQKLNTLLCRINNALLLSTPDDLNIESNERMALKSFRHGLPEPVRSIVVCRNPNSLKDAYDIIKNNNYLHFTHRKNKNNSNSHYSQNKNTYSHNTNNSHQSSQNSGYFQRNQNHSGNFKNNYTPSYKRIQNYSNTNNQSDRNSGNSRTSQNQYNNDTNSGTFRHSHYQNNTYTHPEAMDISANEKRQNFPQAGTNNYPI